MKLTSKAQVIRLLIKMYKYRGRHTQIVFGEPLPAKPVPRKPAPKNIVGEALKIQAFFTEDPQRTLRHASQHFKVSKARICQLMKIVDVLPEDFVKYMGHCQDLTLIKRFSGRMLLRIAGLESSDRRKEAINYLMRIMNSNTQPTQNDRDNNVIQ